MPGIFINYRRDDAPGVAGRLYDHLAKSFSRGDLFMDVDAIKAGLDFVKQLDNQVAHCDVLLALIGPHWLTAKDEKGERRLKADRDYVRIEIAAALKRDIPVIPVLIDGARLPSEDDLPEDLASLCRRHALELRHTRFAADADAIVTSLKDYLTKPRKKWAWSAAAALLAGAVALAAAFYFLTARTSPETEIASPSKPNATQPSVVTSPTPLPSESTTEDATSPGPKSTMQQMRARLEEARRKMEEAKLKIEAAKGGSSPTEAQPADSEMAPDVAVAPATVQASGRLDTLSVVPGVPYDSMRSVYPTAAENDGDLNMPLDGIRFEFTKDNTPRLEVDPNQSAVHGQHQRRANR